jgi:hypothetical protein
MKRLADAVDDAEKRRRRKHWSWCRNWNGFSDLPIWRVVAQRLNIPLYQVVAFVYRLDAFANDAGNKGYARGEVAHFSAEEFAIALGMSAEDAARIYNELEHPTIGWIAYGQVADFNDRNKDREDETAALRQRRKRARRDILKYLAALARQGKITAADRNRVEDRLRGLPDPELFALEADLARAELSPRPYVTRDNRDSVDNARAGENLQSDQRGSSCPPVTRDSRRDSVTVTPEESRGVTAHSVDNSGAAARGATAQSSDEGAAALFNDPQSAAAAWLMSTGVKIVTQRMDEHPGTAATRVQRWLDQQMSGDAVALREIIEGVAAGDTTVARFLVLVTDGMDRWKRRPQPTLPLLTPIRKVGA